MKKGKRLPRKLKKKLGHQKTKEILTNQNDRIATINMRKGHRRMEMLVGFDNYWNTTRYRS